MIYISLPQGWEFTKKEILGTLKDVFVETGSDNVIIIQDLIQDELRSRRKRKAFSRINNAATNYLNITFYFSTPPETTERFLTYVPARNGKEPTTEEPTLLTYSRSPRLSPIPFGLWFQHEPLSARRRAEVEANAEEQRENRRHSGNSPLAT